MTSFTWNNLAGGDWSTRADWTPTGIPGGGDDAVISGTGTYTVTVSVAESAGTLTISDANATVSIQAGVSLSLLGSVVNSGTMALGHDGRLLLTGSIANRGLISVGNSYLEINSPTVVLSGGGTVQMTDGLGELIAAAAGDGVDNIDNTIAGTGQIGNSAVLAFTNEAGGVIDANSSGNTLTIDTATATLVNKGLIEANGGSLYINSSINNVGGTIAAVGSGITLKGGTIAGGTLTSTGVGQITIYSGSNVGFDGSASPLTNLGTTALAHDGRLLLTGSIANRGLISVGNSYLEINSPTVVLSGGGTVQMTDGLGELIAAVAGDGVDNIDNTVAGTGHIGNSAVLAFTNEAGGVIDANSSGNTLTIDTATATLVNKGLIEANGGSLYINSSINNVGGTIAAVGSGITLKGGTIAGGTLTSTGVGQITIYSGSTVGFDGSASPLTNLGTMALGHDARLLLTGSIANRGLISVGNSYLEINSPTVVLSGGGTVQMTDGLGELIAAAAGDGLDNIDNTIAGTGQIGAGADLALINEAAGVIAAGGGGITLNTGTVAAINKGLIEANGGPLIINCSIANSGGTIAGIGGSQVTIAAGAAVSGFGTLAGAIDNLGMIEAIGGTLTNLGTLDTAAGTLIVDPAVLVNSGAIVGTVTLGSGGYVDNTATGTITATQNAVYAPNATATVTNSGTLAGTGTGADGIRLNVGGTVTNAAAAALVAGYTDGVEMDAGTGIVINAGTLAGTGDNGRGVSLAAGTLTNSAGGVITGAQYGAFLGGADTVANAGTIAAGAGATGLRMTGSGTIDNTGTIEGGNIGIFLDNGGNVTNSGSIVGNTGIDDSSGPGVLINSGGITGTGGSGAYMYSGGTVVNTGTIVGAGANGVGVNMHNGGTIDNAAGLISGGHYGVSLGGAGGTVTNLGAIIGGVDGVIMRGTVELVVNSGVISNTNATTGDGVYLIGGNVTNAAAGLIEGFGGVGIGQTAGIVVNLGTIEGTGAGAAGVSLYAGSTLTNAGTIIGNGAYAVSLVGNGHRVIIDPGAVFVGGINGNGGSNNITEFAAGAAAGTLNATGFFGNFAGANLIEVDASAAWLMTGAPNFDAGETLVDSGTLTFAGNVTNAGTIDIAAGGTLVLDGSVGGAGNIDLLGTGRQLAISGSAMPANVISGFAPGDAIDFASLAYSSTNSASYNRMTHVLTVSGATTDTLTMAGIPAGTRFVATGDGHGGTLVKAMGSGMNFTSTNTGIVLNNGTQNPATVVSGAYVTNNTASYGGDAVYGKPNYPWVFSNYGTINATRAGSRGIQFANGGTVINAAGGFIGGNYHGIEIDGTRGAVSNLGTILSSYPTYDLNRATTILMHRGGVVVNGDATHLSALISGAGYSQGVYFGNFRAAYGPSAAGTVLNYGTIASQRGTGIVMSQGGTVINSNLISGGTGWGIYIRYGLVTNNPNAQIAGTGFGIRTFGPGIGGLLTVANQGTIAGTTAGVLLQEGGLITNSGVITGYSNGVEAFNVGATVINSGTIAANATHSFGIDLTDGGLVTNGVGGLIVANQNGVAVNGATGNVNNYGLIKAVGALTAGNFATGVILFKGGTVNNFGTIQSTGTTGTGVNLQSGGNVANASTAGLIVGYSNGVFATGAVATVTNLGTILSTGTDSFGVFLGAGGVVTNASTGLIESAWEAITGGTVAGTVINFGTIVSTASIRNGGTLNLEGPAVQLGQGGIVINGSAGSTGALITGYEFGVSMGTSNGVVQAGAPGTVINYGTIASTGTGPNANDALRLAAGGVVTNHGFIESAAKTALSIGTTSFASVGTINNFGLIADLTTGTAGGEAVYLAAGGVVTNYAGGLITGARVGLPAPVGYPGVVEAHNAAATVANYGTIANPNNSNGVNLLRGGLLRNGSNAIKTALINAPHSGVYMGGKLGVAYAGAFGYVINYGTIQNTTTLGPGVELAAGGRVLNVGLIASGRTGVSFHNTAATLGNSGTVVSTAPTSFTAGTGVYLQAGGLITNYSPGLITAQRSAVLLGGTTSAAATVINSGTIVGNVGVAVGAADSGGNTIVNAGLIIGTSGVGVALSGTGNKVVLDIGSVISGNIDGGGGSGDTLELAVGEGVGALNLGITGLTNFGSSNVIQVDAGTQWVIGGPGTLSAGFETVDAGTLTFAGDVNTYGQLLVQQGGVASYADIGNGGIESVQSGGLDISGEIGSGAIETVFGTASGTVISSSGSQVVELGGVAVSVTVDSGGGQTVLGTASGTVLAGVQVVGTGSGGAVGAVGAGNGESVAVNTTISSGGVQGVLSGGVASGSIISAGGQELVTQGGTMADATIAGGLLDLQSGAAAAGTIAFTGFAGAGGGTLEIDGTTMPTTPISGFVFGDTIDLRGLTSSTNLSAGIQGGVLSVTSAGTVVDQLTLSGVPDGTQFTLTSDVEGGTAIGRAAPKIAFMTGSVDPWGPGAGGNVNVPPTDPGSDEGVMNTAFGAGNWTKFQGFNASALTAGYQFIYIDGSDGDAGQFDSFINSNLSAIENFVAGGGRLFINAARWLTNIAAADTNLNLGFGGVTFEAGKYSSIGTALQPTNPIFNGPNGSAGTSWTGNFFSHDFVTGNGLNNLIQGTAANTGIALAGEKYGAGYVLFGGLTLPFFHSPQPQGDILGANILDYAAGGGTIGIPAPTDLALSPASESGIAGSNDTNVTTPVITGDGVAGDTVTVFDGSTVAGTATVQASGTWAVTTSVLANGVHSITATESDSNGRVSPPSVALSLTIDTQPPQTAAAALSVAANAGATAIGIAAPTDSEDTFTIKVDTLPTNGSVTLGDGATPVTVGETLSVAQLTGLDFAPNSADGGTNSSFTYTVTDTAGNSSVGTAGLSVSSGGNLFSFLFTYNDGKDYFQGTVADNGTFGYKPGETLSTSAGLYTILGNLGSTGQAAGTVFVTNYSHDGPGQASAVPVDTAAGVPDSTAGLLNVSDAVLGLDGLSHPFSASSEVNFTTNALYGFVFDYSDGREFYSGTVATAQGSSPTIPTSPIGSYSVFFEGLTARTAGSVSVDRFVVGSTSFIPKTSGGNGNTDGTGGLGSEVDSITVNGATSVFSDTLEPTVFLATPSLPSTLPPTAGSVLQSEVYDLYADVFNRIPDAAGLATYTNDLANGESIATLRAVLANSAEAQSYLNTLFNIVFSRPIDASGDATYTADLVNGSSLSAIQAIIAQSPEAQARIQTFYQSVLNRSADPAGLVNAMGFLAAGGSLQAIQIIFAHSAEAAGDLANNIFKPVFGRIPDAAELVGMEDQLAANGASQSTVVPGGGVTKVVPPAGSQILTAAAGTPTEFDFSHVAFTADTINGFDPTQDALVLPSALAGSFTQSSSGGSTLISFANDPSQSILLSSVASDRFASTNFRFA